MDTLKIKKAWEVALGPIKGLPMTGIMMYMSGNSLQIFSIMMVFMAFKNPLMGILATNQAFERFETDGNRARLLQVKLAYVAMQVVALALGVWKVNSMGLLPYVSALHVGRWGVIELTLTGTARRGRIGLLGRHRGSRWRGRCRRCRFYTFEWEWQEFFLDARRPAVFVVLVLSSFCIPQPPRDNVCLSKYLPSLLPLRVTRWTLGPV